MRFLRRVKGCRRRHLIFNEDLSEELGINSKVQGEL